MMMKKEADQKDSTEANLRAALNASNDHIYILDREYEIVLLNERAKASIRQFFNKDFLKGDTIIDYMPEENKPQFKERMQRAFNGETIQAESHIVTASGTPMWFDVRYVPIANEANEITQVSLSFNDITARKENEQRLLQQDEQLSILADNIPRTAVFQYLEDNEGTYKGFTYLSSGAFDLFGFSFEQVKMQPTLAFDIMHPDDLAEITHLYQQARAELTQSVITHRIVVNHKVKWIYTRAKPTQLSDGSYQWAGVSIDVTERELPKQALALSEANLKAIVENSDTAYALYDRDFKVVSFNKLAQTLTETYLNTTLTEGFYGIDFFPESRNRILADYFELALEDMPSSYQVNFGSDEKPLWLYNRVFPVKDDHGKIYGIVFALTDITLLKESNAKLVRSQKLFESMINSQSSYLVRTDMLGHYSFVNKRFLDSFGFQEHEVIGRHSFETIYIDDQAACKKAVMECIYHPGKIVPVAFRKPNKKGDYFMTEWEFVAIQNEMGEVTDIQGIGYDVTEKLSVQNKLVETSNRLSLATQAAGMGVWVWNTTTHKLDWDDQMYKIYGLDPNRPPTFELFNEIIHPEDKEESEKNVSEILKTRHSINFLFRIIRHTDKEVRYIQTLGMFSAKNPNEFTGVNIDITERIEKEKAFTQAESQIEELQLRALRAAMNPHFIFNALNSIQFFITQNEQESAINYLSKFSKLVRGILVSSNTPQSTLASELELIQYYVGLEQLRFENKFDYELEVGEELDTETILLPSFLIQPYVENAIVHGLYTKEARGMLRIAVAQENTWLTIIIEDNGIGRAAATLLRKKNFPEHRSLGMDITATRIELINEQQPIETRVEDLYINEQPAGTRITLRLKIE